MEIGTKLDTSELKLLTHGAKRKKVMYGTVVSIVHEGTEIKRVFLDVGKEYIWLNKQELEKCREL